MNTPTLRHVHCDDERRALIGATASLPLFEVVMGGVYGGRRYRSGDVIECAASRPVDKDVESAWVLVPRGMGRPVLGRHQHDGLYGSVGERCHPVRWQPAGEVQRVWRRRDGAWAHGQAEQDVGVDVRLAPAPRLQRRSVTRSGPRHQLPLFGALQAA